MEGSSYSLLIENENGKKVEVDRKIGSWLNDVTIHYRSLSNDNRNIVLKELIANSEQSQIEFLDTHLPPLICKDFITHLSLEHVTMIFKRLSGKDILTCCQVCKSWRDRINSLTDLWETKAFEVGVNVQAISEKYSQRNEMSRVFKTSYCLAARFLSDLEGCALEDVEEICHPRHELRNDIHFMEDSIVVGDVSGRRVEIYSVPDWTVTHEVITRFPMLPCYKHSLVFTRDYDGSAYCWNVETNSDLDIYNIYTSDSDSENVEQENRSFHKIQSGSYHIIDAIDVTVIMDETFVVTGANCIMLWKMHPTRKNCELLMTLDKEHSDIQEIHILPHDGDKKLRFISRCWTKIYIWSVDLKTHKQEYSCMNVDKIITFFFEASKPEDIFIIHWNHESKPVLASYRICRKNVAFERMDHWNLSKQMIPACILGVGSRFAFLMRSDDLQTFQLFDLTTRRSIVTFTSAYRFLTLPVKLYNSSWLDGFVFEDEDVPPMVMGIVSLRDLSMLKLELPVLEDHLNDSSCDSDSNSCESDSCSDSQSDDLEQAKNAPD